MEDVDIKTVNPEIEEESSETKGEEEPLEKKTKAELIEIIGETRIQSEKNYDLYLRAKAETENIKKRNTKEKAEWVKYANEGLIKEILPVLDNLEKALSHSSDKNSLQALREGVELTLKGLMDGLKKSGVQEIEALGAPFDPCFHQAVSELQDDEVDAGLVLKELQKGYALNGRLIRPSMVVVSKGKGTKPGNNDESSARASCEE